MASVSSESSEGSTLGSLADQIDDVMRQSLFDSKEEDFAPHDAIDRIISPENRDSILRALGQSQDLDIVDRYILENAKKLFANSIHGSDFNKEDLLPAMKLLREKEFSDESLPIEENVMQERSVLN